MAYGSVAGVQAYVRHMTLDAGNNPTTAQVEGWLAARSATLDGWIAAAGYALPIVDADVLVVLSRYANVGAAGDAELAQRSAGYSASDQNKRENKFLSEFDKARAWIESGALGALGVPEVEVETTSQLPQVGTLTAGTLAENPPRLGRPPEWDYRFGR